MAERIRTFRVVAGIHVTLNGKEVKTGEMIRSRQNLCEIFPCKFEEVLPVAESKVIVEDEEPEKEPAPLPPKPPKPPVKEEETEKAPEAKLKPPAVRESKLGKDVTDRFELAKEVTLAVFRKGNRYQVTEEEELDYPLTEKSMSKDELVSYLQKEKEKQDADA